MKRPPGAKAVLAYKGKILLILRDAIPTIPNPNTWSTPGGAIETGEMPAFAIERELYEEICVVPKTIDSIGVTQYSDGSIVYRFFSEITDSEYAQIRLGNEGQRLAWFSISEALELPMGLHARMYYQKYAQELQRALETGIPPQITDEWIELPKVGEEGENA